MDSYRRILLGIVGLLLGTCSVEEGFRFVKSSSPPAEAVWRSGNLFVTGERMNLKNMVMVTIRLGSHTYSYFKSHPQLKLFKEPLFLEPGYALLEVPSGPARDELAKKAHAGGGCGSIEALNLLLEDGTNSITAPVYHERTELSAVNSLLEMVSQDNLEASVSTLASLGTRMHSTTTGKQASSTIAALFTSKGEDIDGITITKESHSSTSQKSVIIKIPGESSTTKVILGAHLDSINNSDNEDAPGADDDATGVATLLEVLRVINDSGATFNRAIELHAYAAEEVGLVGSQDIASSYASAGSSVSAMMQIDMNGYSSTAEDETIFIVENGVNGSLKRSLKELLKTYLGGSYQEKTLGTGTSDYKSWHGAGYAAVFPFEDPGAYNSKIHTSNDTVANINNFPLTTRFTKLALAFLAHHAGLASASDAYDEAIASKKPEFASSTDLPLAIIKNPENESEYLISTGAGPEITRLELCRISNPSSSYCFSERRTSEAAGSIGNRSLFLNNTSYVIAAGDRFRLYGYNEDDELVAVRSIRLEAQ